MSLWSKLEKGLGKLLPDEVRDELIGARRLLEQGRIADAREMLLALRNLRPDHAPIHALLGQVFLAEGNRAEAEAATERALALDPKNAEALVGRGQFAFQDGDRPAAIAAFRAAAQAADGDRATLAAAYRGLGGALLFEGELDKAIRELRKAVAEAPNHAETRALLGHALRLHPNVPVEEARRHLERAVRANPAPASAWLDLGALELAAGSIERAIDCFSQIKEDPRALEGLGDAEVARQAFAAAQGLYRQATTLDPNRPHLYGKLGDALREMGELAEAEVAYERALGLERSLPFLERALALALETERVERAVELAHDVIARAPTHPRAHVARARGFLRAGKIAEANAALDAARGPDVLVALTRGQVLLSGDSPNPAGALYCAQSALREEPGHPEARRVLADARSLQFPTLKATGPLPRLHALLPVLRALPELEGELARLEQIAVDIDQALLVTVMGEFSSGKSSFVNAFIGADIAPVGVTPTTSTINLAKFGREHGGRLRYRGGRIEELGWDALRKRLDALGPEDSRNIEVVELLLPLPQLEQIHLVDTPGLNSMIPEHEEVARRFFARADAVVWVLAAGQAGKATEREALRAIREQGVRVLAVLNKVDQLSDKDLAAATRYVEEEFKGLVDLVVPFSARRVLAGQDDGNLSRLNAALEEHFFKRARELKRDAALRRMQKAETEANALVNERHDNARRAHAMLLRAAELVEKRQEAFASTATAERRRLVDGMTDLYRRAARETLELVQPRNTPFGSHQATRADRDYLLSVLEDGFAALLAPSRARLTEELTAVTTASLSELAELPALFEEGLEREIARAASGASELLEAQVFSRAVAYLEGYLRGGAIDGFFRTSLPRIELNEDAVYGALYREAPDLDAVLREPLKAAATSAFRDIVARLRHRAGVAADRAYDLEVGVMRALSVLP